MIRVNDIPFSLEILSRSIESAGISPKKAKKISFHIKKELEELNLYDISRDDLREIVIRHLKKEFTQEYIDSYLIWSKFRKREDSIVVLIGGSTGSGKSTVAAEVAHRLGITRIVSTDMIRSIMRSLLTDQLTPLLHKSSYNAWEELDIPLPITEDKVILAFREQVNQVAVGIQATIERALLENISIVIEGVHIVPGFIRQKYLKHPKVITLSIVTNDALMHKQRFNFRGTLAPNRPSKRYLKYFVYVVVFFRCPFFKIFQIMCYCYIFYAV